jgi:Domain of Unknown Function (DUF1080)
MNRLKCVSLLLPFILLTGAERNFAQNVGSIQSEQKRIKHQTIKLFNGNDLGGWYTYLKRKGKNIDPNKVFTVPKGVIRISGEEFGCITTNEEFENYQLDIEFKWGEKTFPPRVDNARDSGILLHSIGEDGAFGEVWMCSVECQLIEGGTGDILAVGNSTSNILVTAPVETEKQGGSYLFKSAGNPVTINSGRINWWGRDPLWKDIKGFRGAKDLENPLGKWNKLKVIAKQNQITIYLNGRLVNFASDVKPQKGKIQIQSEGAEIFFRKVDLTSLSAK